MGIIKQSIDRFLEIREAKREETGISDSVERQYVTAVIFYKYISDCIDKSNTGYTIEEDASFKSCIEKIKNNAFDMFEFQRVLIELQESTDDIDRQLFSHINVSVDNIGRKIKDKTSYIKELFLDIDDIDGLNKKEEYIYFFNRVANVKKSHHLISNIRTSYTTGLLKPFVKNKHSIYLPFMDNLTVTNVLDVIGSSTKIEGTLLSEEERNIVSLHLIMAGAQFKVNLIKHHNYLSSQLTKRELLYVDLVDQVKSNHLDRKDKEELFSTFVSKIDATGVAIFFIEEIFVRRQQRTGLIDELIERNAIDAIIQLSKGSRTSFMPENNIILIINNNKKTDDILFIDGTLDKVSKRKITTLTDQHIQNINETLVDRKTIKGYSTVVKNSDLVDSMEKISVHSYVQEIDIDETMTTDDLYKKLTEIDKTIEEKEQKINHLLKQLFNKL
ncbi:N-6 DNA methylase [Nosocomiicoccus sp. HMSC09A07]|uniref:N-6 DNA methylase n=1 Tax=Nosocomiicoccus sp. HMSC09A07 TaxID=1581145 RepID=UPI0008A4E44F|nr:N-6 DNA methylase [Nosocomiicoccus sp. HMSC09A07]OFS62289.1 hypothetical protein HMPREF3177_05975 [Nosocomiicoccus sp. HMSC09A07]